VAELSYCGVGLHLTLQIAIAQDERLQQSQWNKRLVKMYVRYSSTKLLTLFVSFSVVCTQINRILAAITEQPVGWLKFYEAEFIKFLIIMKIDISRNEYCIKERKKERKKRKKKAKFLGLQIFNRQNWKSCIELILSLSNNLYSKMSQISR
jgi:hypothetical protein